MSSPVTAVNLVTTVTMSPSSPHSSPSLEHHSSFKGKKQICTVYSCCVPFFFLYYSFKHTCLRSLFSCWLLTANKLMPSTDTARSHFIQGALRDIKGVPKKSTFWVAVLQNRLWGYVAFHCQLSSQLAVEGHVPSSSEIQKLRFLGHPVGQVDCVLKY